MPVIKSMRMDGKRVVLEAGRDRHSPTHALRGCGCGCVVWIDAELRTHLGVVVAADNTAAN
eukprot:4854388-Prymnesium_polylepis.2